MSIESASPQRSNLAEFVDKIWFCEIGNSNNAGAGTEMLMPTGRAQLIFGLHESAPDAFVQGPTATAHSVRSDLQRRAVGISFRGGGLSRITHEQMGSLLDCSISLQDLFGSEGTNLHEELAEIDDRASIVDHIEQFLTRRLIIADRPLDLAVQRAVELLSVGTRIGTTAELVGLTRRQLVSRFRSEVGLAPKRFARLRRFESVMVSIRRADAGPLAAIAVANGFADQSHMTREFADFGAPTPATLHRDASQSPNHVVS